MAETLEELERRLGLIDKEEDKKPTRLQAINKLLHKVFHWV